MIFGCFPAIDLNSNLGGALLFCSAKEDAPGIEVDRLPTVGGHFVSSVGQAPFFVLRIARNRRSGLANVHHLKLIGQVVVQSIGSVPFDDGVLVLWRMRLVLCGHEADVAEKGCCQDC